VRKETIFLSIAVLVGQVTAVADVSSTFDSDLDGWTLVGNPTLSHQATNGNPGGFARYDDTPGPLGDGWIVAPPKFLGNWTSLDGVGQLSWDHRILSPGEGETLLNGQARISGPGGIAVYYSGVVFTTLWQTFTAPLEESAWIMTAGSWDALLSNVTDLRIRIESAHNDGPALDVDGIDNVSLSSEPTPACISSVFDTNLEGWTLIGNPVLSHQESGGNPSGFARYDDTPGPLGDGWIVAPAEFLGDWSSLDGVGWLSWDHKILDLGQGGGNILFGQAKISGPGGGATYTSSIQFTTYWTAFLSPLNESDWFLASGSWSELLANITELQLRIEGVHSVGPALSVNGIDNVSLCPPPRKPIPPDFDGDGDVDKDDLRAFDACANDCIVTNVNCDAAGVNVLDLQYVKNNVFCTDEMDKDCIVSDVNRDGSVNVIDLQDVKNVVFCADTSASVLPGCEWADFDNDNDVDHNDYAVMQGCISGPNVPADPNCADFSPRIDTYSNSGCLPGDAQKDGYPWCGDDTFEMTAEAHSLHVTHRNATYNCCPDDIRVELTVAGRTLHLTEEEILTMPCACLCCYDVETTVVGLSPGTYTVEYCWADNELGPQCHTEDVSVP